MKTTTCLLIGLSSLFFISCEKDTDSNIPDINFDSLYAILPKQLTYTELYASPVSTFTYSIKYDTANLQIEVYEDDTANSNPYDRIYARYGYNADGYLINFKKWMDGSLNEENKVQRSSDNRIQWIAHSDVFLEQIDTTWFNYESLGSQTTITANNKEYRWGTGGPYLDTIVHVYDIDRKLTEVRNDQYVTTFQYNPNNSLKKILTTFTDFSYTSDFSYASGLIDGKQDMVLQVILGRDYYIQQLKNLYLLASFQDRSFLTVSATDPFHPTMMMDTKIENGATTRLEKWTWVYQLNGQKLLGKINGSVNDEELTIFELKY